MMNQEKVNRLTKFILTCKQFFNVLPVTSCIISRGRYISPGTKRAIVTR